MFDTHSWASQHWIFEHSQKSQIMGGSEQNVDDRVKWIRGTRVNELIYLERRQKRRRRIIFLFLFDIIQNLFYVFNLLCRYMITLYRYMITEPSCHVWVFINYESGNIPVHFMLNYVIKRFNHGTTECSDQFSIGPRWSTPNNWKIRQSTRRRIY